MTKSADTVNDKAKSVANHFESNSHGALAEMHKDIDHMSASDRSKFFHGLKDASQGHKLPGLEIHEDDKHNLTVTEKVHGKNHTLLDETKHDGQPRDANKPQDGTKPDDGFSSGLRKGEGPYQALHRQHPEYTHKQLMDESHKILSATGRHAFKQGEQFKTNSDGTVTTRTPGDARDGSFTENTQKDGKTVESKTGDGKGNWTSQTFDSDGKPTGSVEHKVGDTDGAYTETIKGADQKVISTVNGDKDGKNVETFDKDGNKTASIRESNDSSQVVGWKKNADGTQTNIDQTDANHKTEINTKDGQVINTVKTTTDKDGTNTETYDKDDNQTAAMRTNNDGTSTGWRKNADGTTTSIDGSDKNNRVETTPRDGGTNTDTYDKDGNQTSGMYEKGASVTGWHKNSDGSITSIDQPDANHHSETTTKDGKIISAKSHEQTPKGSTDVYTDATGGTNTNNFDAQGNQISGVRQNPDGTSTGWNKTPKGGTETFDKNAQGHYSAMTFDKQGNVTRTEERDPSGVYTVKEQTAPGIITTYGASKGQFGYVVGHPPRVEEGTLTNPGA